ncbi:MAG: Bug family tripartite tricarboxylate transporter substrate binding protein [Reyranellaceae bacterium]
MRIAAWICAALLAAVALAGPAGAQAYPNQPVRMVIATTPGGMIDPFVRLIGDQFQKELGQPIVMEFKPGAGGLLGGQYVAKAKPDGYTLWLSSVGPLALNPALGNAPYDVQRDFTPIAMMFTTPNVLVVPAALPVKSIPDLVKLSKDKPEGLSYASGGVGASHHLAGELFRSVTGGNFTHIPYKGTTGVTTDLVAGRVQFYFSNVSPVVPLIEAGQLRALAVTSPKRLSLLPNVPTSDEAGLPKFYTGGFLAVVGPAGMPEDMVRKINGVVNRAMQTPEGRKLTLDNAGDPLEGPPETLAKFLVDERAKWTKVVKDNNIKVD